MLYRMTRLCILLVLLAALTTQPMAAPAQPQAAAMAQTPTSSALLDINTATFAELKSLQGIGDAYANRIIKGRPYTMKNQLVSRGILPQATYDHIQGRIIAKHPAK